MIRVIHILNTNSYSGAENVAITIIKNISKDIKYHVTYLAIKGPIEEVLKENNINYYLVDKLDYLTMKKAIKILQPNVIHCHDFTVSILASLVSKEIPIISHIHQNPSWIKTINLKSVLYLLSIHRFSKVLSVSNSFFEEYIFSRFIKNKEVIENIVDVKEIIKYRDDKTKKDIDVIYVGRLSKEKNPIKCLEIFRELFKRNPNFRFALVGDGCLYEKCYEFIENNNLTNIIKMYGFQKNVYSYMNRSKIAINTSEWEGFGLSVVESLGLGLPVVCSDVGGLPSIVNNKCGLLCRNNEDYIKEIEKLLMDEEYYFKKSNCAFCRAKELNNVDIYIDRIKSVYQNLI